MEVRCPHCGVEYLLPRQLLGPKGATVRCPGCGKRFDVMSRGDDKSADAVAPVDEPGNETASPRADGPETIAAELLEDLERRAGPRLAEAQARGRVLAEIGPELMAVFDAYRARLGPEAEAGPFRRAIRERLGIALDVEEGRGGGS